MTADEELKKLGYKKFEIKDYMEYRKNEKDGYMCISIMTKPTISIYIKKNKNEISFPEAIYGEELEAIYHKYLELKEK